MSDLVLVAVVGAPHGVRGELRVKCFTAEPEAIARYGPLRTADGRGRYSVASLRPLKDDLVVARFDGVATREAAAALTHVRLYIERGALPAPGEEEFYHADLVGLSVDLPDGTVLGRVAAVLNHGAGDLLEVAREGGETLLVAFTRAFVPVVDVRGGRVVVSPEAVAGDDGEEDDGGEEGS